MSQLTHKFKKEHEGKTLYVPAGGPSLTVTASELTQEHIDAFDEETQKHFFDKTGYVKPKKEVAKAKVSEDSQELTAEELQAEIDELNEKFENYTEQGKKGKHGQAIQEKLNQLHAMQEQQNQAANGGEPKEWNPNESHTLAEIKNRIADLRHLVNQGGGTPEAIREIDELGKQVNILTSNLDNPSTAPAISASGEISSKDTTAPEGQGEAEGDSKGEEDQKENEKAE